MKWNREAEASGRPALVFTCSWSDFFHVDADPWRGEAWRLIRDTPHLIYQILTKRPALIARRLPADWGEGYPNAWLGVSAERQQEADLRIPLLLQTPAAVRFVSLEPLLGPVRLREEWISSTTRRHISMSVEGALRNRSFDALQDDDGRTFNPGQAQAELERLHAAGVKLVPAAGCDDFDPDSGCRGHARSRASPGSSPAGRAGHIIAPMELPWLASIVEQCRAAGVPVHVKQDSGPKPGIQGRIPDDLWVQEMPAMGGVG